MATWDDMCMKYVTDDFDDVRHPIMPNVKQLLVKRGKALWCFRYSPEVYSDFKSKSGSFYHIKSEMGMATR